MKAENLQPAEAMEHEIATLVSTLNEAEERLEKLTGGQVDTVADRFGRPYLLRRAQAQLRNHDADKLAAILNALPANIALLDTKGVIIAVNEPWRQFATANFLRGPAYGIGLNYLDICDRASGPEESDAHRTAAGIRSVLTGAKSFSIEYSCDSPTEKRWFVLSVTPLSRDQAHGVVVMHLNITERKLSEDATERTLQRLTEAQRVAQIGDWEWDLATQTIMWSPQVFTILGRDPRLGPPRTYEEQSSVYDAPSRALLQDKVTRAIESGESQNYELVALRPDGARIYVQAMAVPKKDERGRIVGVYGTIQDITDRKLSEVEIHESNERFLQLANNISDAFWISSPDMSAVQYISPAYEAIWGRSVASLQANPQEWVESIFNEDRPRVRAAFTALCAERPRLDMEYRIVRPDGVIRWVRVRVSQIRSEADQLIRHVGIASDITERKHSREALAASQRRFKALFEQAAVGVALAEASTGRFVQVNQRFADILGRSRAETEELTFSAVTHPQDAAVSKERLRELIAGKIRNYAHEKRYLRKDGTVVWVSLTVSAMWPPFEKPSLCIAVVQDITERKHLDEHFLQAQKMEALGQFSGGVAHDFNNILAAISGYTELSGMLLQGNPAVRGHLDSVLKASSRASDLVKQILTFSRQQPQDREPIQLQQVVKESIKFLRATIPATIAFDTLIAADAPTVLGNANQIHQVLTNLGINAWHAMQDGPGLLRITLEKWQVDDAQTAAQPRLRPGSYARLSISDTGCGMDTATVKRIFEPFFTTKPVGKGTGLGLAVVHGIMDSHDGAVTVYSQPEQGTVFHLYFPACAGEIGIGAITDGPTPNGKGEAVLVVDDEEMIASMLQLSLNHLNYATEFTTDPVAALAMVKANPAHYRLVLSDFTMPGMTGLDLAIKLREIRPDLPVLLMTGLNAALTPERLEEAGVRRVLIKPLTIHLLGSALHAVLSAEPN